MTTRMRMAAAGVALVALIGGACGDDSDEEATTTTTSAAAAADAPRRIVSLSPTATEMLFAIGAGDQVVAVDDQSNYPAEAPKTDLSGFKPNVEAIAAHQPDLVVISDGGGELEATLAKVKIRTLAAPAAASLDDTYEQLRQLGDATGHRDEADKVVARMRKDIESITASIPAGAKGATYYHELDPSYFSATSKTFIGSVYALLGLENIADAADAEGGGYPQLSAEYIVQADPD
ncbi:MAG: ABC transporter substrate-binding protein, partial [Acidimicrobiales bacterium]